MISILLAALTLSQLISIILVITFLFLGFKLLETTWSYRISKPHQWDEAIKAGRVSPRLKKMERLYRDKVRFYSLWFQIERLKKEKVEGAFAELGVYKGETARIIHAMDPSRNFHLFDTFEGFDKKDLSAEAEVEAVDFSDTSVERVIQFIGGNDHIFAHQGHFPSTAHALTGESFAFVHLDADLYLPTVAALKYFYPRLSPSGVVIIHDYNHNWAGVRKAVDEFMPGIPEALIEIADWQGSVVIVKNKSQR